MSLVLKQFADGCGGIDVIREAEGKGFAEAAVQYKHGGFSIRGSHRTEYPLDRDARNGSYLNWRRGDSDSMALTAHYLTSMPADAGAFWAFVRIGGRTRFSYSQRIPNRCCRFWRFLRQSTQS